MIGGPQSEQSGIPAERGRSSFEAPDVDGLFAAFDRKRAQAAGPGLVIVFAACAEPAMRLRNEIEKLGAVVMIVEDVFVSESWVASLDERVACMIFDMRFLASRGAEELPARLRAAAANPAIILLTETRAVAAASVKGNDMAEIALSTPVTGSELRLGVLSAIERRQSRFFPLSGLFRRPVFGAATARLAAPEEGGSRP